MMRSLSLLGLRPWSQRICCFSATESELPPPYLEPPTPTHQIPRKMQAWQIHGYGNLKELQLSTSARVPMIQSPCDVLVKVNAASVNPIDIRMVEGYGWRALNFMRFLQAGMTSTSPEFPLTLGRDFSGKVVAKGHAVHHVEVGQSVWGVASPSKQGSHAGYVLASSSEVGPKPSNLSDVEAATIPYAALSVWSALTITGGVSPHSASNQSFLVLGASGGTGTIAIQLLKAWGGYVVATCRTDAVDMVESLNPDRVVDYTQPNATEAILADGRFDLVLDLTGSPFKNQMDLLKSKAWAKYVTLTHPFLRNINGYGLALGTVKTASDVLKLNASVIPQGRTVRWALFMPSRDALDQLAHLVSSGQIRPVVEKVFPFEETPIAFEKLYQGHNRGKTVIQIIPSK